MTPSPSMASLTEALKQIPDPHWNLPLSRLRAVEEVTEQDGKVQVRLKWPTPAYPHPERIDEEIRRKAAEAGAAEKPVEIEHRYAVQGKNTGGSIGLNVRNVIAVGSGKGGVGKSTLAAALALGLKHLGARVGLMDADVYGPSIPHLLSAKGEPMAEEIQGPDGNTIRRILPILCDDLPLMSMGFFIQPDQAVIWRGPMLHRALTQFLQDTYWGDLDYLVIDLPPGTGDVSLTLSQLVGLAGAVVVCTPQEVALLDAVKAINMYRELKVPVLGLVENMSGEIFGRGGAKARAEQLQIPFLGEIPALAAIREHGDRGAMAALFAEDSPAREALLEVTRNTALEIARNLLESPSLPQLEVLS